MYQAGIHCHVSFPQKEMLQATQTVPWKEMLQGVGNLSNVTI